MALGDYFAFFLEFFGEFLGFSPSTVNSVSSESVI